jgi:hypothetical protein
MRQRFWHGELPVLLPFAPALKLKRLHWNINALACFRACSGYSHGILEGMSGAEHIYPKTVMGQPACGVTGRS